MAKIWLARERKRRTEERKIVEEMVLGSLVFFWFYIWRLSFQEYAELLHEFMNAVKQNYGEKILVQFEDFANHNAFDLLEKYRSTHLVFNDDIQGTAAVVLAGLIAALKLVGGDLLDHRFLFLGAGEVFPERQGKWKATTQSRGFLKSIKRYYSNAYTDGYFQPHEGKPALWELDSDYYLHVCGIGDDLIPEKCSEPNPKPSGRGGIIFTPIPACREDFLWIKLTSFDKLIEKTCSTIRNVRLCSEPDQRPGGTSGNSGVAPDVATENVGLHFERRPNIRRVYERRNKGVKRNVEVAKVESNCALDRFLYWYKTRPRFSRLGLPDRADLDPHGRSGRPTHLTMDG
ncbi:hypothetical protein VNO80_08439 [Phaseolus coccineus]|uniref:Malic enzyme n=1 Tax=Phaseolus coccineus TaxID=3886 RepID=A0AAN9NM41_PHACN